MKYLITGGAGFIGSAVIRYIIQNTQHEVLNIDKLTYAGNLESLAEIEQNSRYYFNQIDICDKKMSLLDPLTDAESVKTLNEIKNKLVQSNDKIAKENE